MKELQKPLHDQSFGIVEPRKISWTWSLWKIWAKKTNNHSQIMAIVLIKSDSAGFFVQISSQNHGATLPHQMNEC